MKEELAFDSHEERIDALAEERLDPHRSALVDPRLTIGCFLVIGALLSLINFRWPVTRNALDYMKATVEIIGRHFDLISVAHDHVSMGGKPLLFPLMATPFVWLLGANSAVIVASTVGTGLFLVTAELALGRLSKMSHGKLSDSISLGLTLTALNPLVLYQFWSGYPDSLFAGLILLAFLLSDMLAEDEVQSSVKYIVLLGLIIVIAVHTKVYGAVLMLTCPLYIFMRSNGRTIRLPWRTTSIVYFLVVWSLILTVLIIAKLGYDPLLTLDANSGFSGYVAIFRITVVEQMVDSLQMLCFSIFLAFHLALVFLFKREAWRVRSMAPAVFIGIYIAGLIPYWGTGINMRYFLPAFPFIAYMLASGARATSPMARRLILYSYFLVAIALVLNFNVAWVEGFTQEMMAKAYSRYPNLAGWLDNLRMPVQIALNNQIDAINKNVPDGSILYWSSDYYKTATHGLAHQLGVKKTLDVRYVLEPSYPPYSSRPVFLAEFTPTVPHTTLWRAPSWATPTSYGNGLFRLDPASVQLMSLSGDFVMDGKPLRIRANINPRDPYRVRDVEFLELGYTIARSLRPPFEMTRADPTPGRHEIFARVNYVERASIISSPLDIYVGVSAIERVADDTDDLSMEFEDGVVNATQDLLWLDQKNRAVGIRFRNISVRQAVLLANAHLRLTSAQSQTGRTVLDIRAEFSPNARGLLLEDGDLSKRTSTTAHVIWELGQWSAGQTWESPDLTPVLEQVFSQKGWRSGNSLVILIRISGKGRFAQAATESGRSAPRLQIALKQ